MKRDDRVAGPALTSWQRRDGVGARSRESIDPPPRHAMESPTREPPAVGPTPQFVVIRSKEVQCRPIVALGKLGDLKPGAGLVTVDVDNSGNRRVVDKLERLHGFLDRPFDGGVTDR